MRGRLTDDQRAARHAEANELARQRATQWRVWKKDKEGHALAAFDIVDAPSERAAIIQVLDRLDIRESDARAPKGAQPLLRSDEWRDIYQEVGLA